MISIITVNWNSYDFLDIMIESLERYSSLPYELIVIDNSVIKHQISRDNVAQHLMSENIGHGEGLNRGVKLAKFDFVMFLDVDAHILCHNWEEPFLRMMEQFDVIGGRGVPAKPIRPACMFLKKEFSGYDWRPSDGYKGHRITPEGTDVAIRAFYQMQADGVRIGFLEGIQSRYDTHTGEEWCIESKPLVYHHWHGSHLAERQVDFTIDLHSEKKKLFDSIAWRVP